MARRKTSKTAGGPNNAANGANLGFEARLWETADKLRNNMDAAERKRGKPSSPNSLLRLNLELTLPCLYTK